MHSKHDFLKQVWTFRGYSASNFQKSANLVNGNTLEFSEVDILN